MVILRPNIAEHIGRLGAGGGAPDLGENRPSAEGERRDRAGGRAKGPRPICRRISEIQLTEIDKCM